MLPLVGYLATVQFKLQTDMLYLKGKRIKILNEVISGIKVDIPLVLKRDIPNAHHFRKAILKVRDFSSKNENKATYYVFK